MYIIYYLAVLAIELLPNRVYKLFAESGSGKTIFLKAITNNWQYTEGIVKLPGIAEDNICFVPQGSFIPSGTLLEVLTYPFEPRKIASKLVLPYNFSMNQAEENNEESKVGRDLEHYYTPLSQRLIEEDHTNLNHHYQNLITKVKHLLTSIRLMPNTIKVNELESNDINWGNRLSEGEKQKIGIVRAL